MIIEVPFGEQTIEAEFPDHTFRIPGTAMPKLPPVDDIDSAVAEALAHPIGSPAIPDLVTPSSKVTIAFDDPTVPAFGPIRGVAITGTWRETRRRT